MSLRADPKGMVRELFALKDGLLNGLSTSSLIFTLLKPYHASGKLMSI